MSSCLLIVLSRFLSCLDLTRQFCVFLLVCVLLPWNLIDGEALISMFLFWWLNPHCVVSPHSQLNPVTVDGPFSLHFCLYTIMMDEFVLSLCPFVECLKFHGLHVGWGSTFPWFGSFLLHDSSWLYFLKHFVSTFKSLCVVCNHWHSLWQIMHFCVFIEAFSSELVL